MQWRELSVKVPAKDLQTAEDIANMTVSHGISVEDYSDLEFSAEKIAHTDLIDPALLAKDKTAAVIRIYFDGEPELEDAEAYITERLGAAGIDYAISRKSVDEKDWAENWKRYFKPVEIGEKLAVCPTWENYRRNGNRTVLKIDPGAAFGTGTHATTRLCLEMMQDFISGGERVLDVGCGSGILGIAAALLGAAETVGVDIDPLAARVANENAELNGVGDVCRFFEGNLTDTVHGEYDVCFANIVADTVIELLKSAGGCLKPGGIMLCSGIIDARKQDVLAAASGFEMLREREKDGWCAMMFARRV